jgi:hypothetical protein
MKHVFRAVLAVVLCISVAACNPSQNGGGTPTVTFNIAFNTWLGYSALVIAKEKGFLKKRGLDRFTTRRYRRRRPHRRLSSDQRGSRRGWSDRVYLR